jgi:hypothetical protein
MTSENEAALIAATFAKRVGCRADHVAKTADYVCDLETALDTAHHFLVNASQASRDRAFADVAPGSPQQLTFTVQEGAVVLARDAVNNYAMLWGRAGRWDLLVSLSEGFGEPVAMECVALGCKTEANPYVLEGAKS